MGKVEDLHLFTMVVEHRGIANAAARLNIAKSAVSRRLSLLEDRYSTNLSIALQVGGRLQKRAANFFSVQAVRFTIFRRLKQISKARIQILLAL